MAIFNKSYQMLYSISFSQGCLLEKWFSGISVAVSVRNSSRETQLSVLPKILYLVTLVFEWVSLVQSKGMETKVRSPKQYFTMVQTLVHRASVTSGH